MIDKVSIGKIIKNLRIGKNLTQEELSEKVNISKNYLSKVERGISILNTETFLKMAEVLEFSLEDFIAPGIKKSNEAKQQLINRILLLNEKETAVYSSLFNTADDIIKIFS